MATDNSTAAPKVMVSSEMPCIVPLPKMVKQRMMVRMNSAAMATVLTLPRFLMPIRIQRTISAPMTRHQIQLPTPHMPLAANAPS